MIQFLNLSSDYVFENESDNHDGCHISYGRLKSFNNSGLDITLGK